MATNKAKQMTVGDLIAAQDQSKVIAAETAGIKLEQRYVDASKEIGAVIGAYSLAKDSSAEGLRKAALMLFDLQVEGAIGICNPRAENFIARIIMSAWIAKYGEKVEFKIKGEQVLANSQTSLRRISKALSLDGFLYRTDDAGSKVKIPVRDNLLRMLEGWSSTDASGKVTHYTGRFNPAVAKAGEWIKLHEQLCVADAEYAMAVGYNPETPGGKRGRDKKEPSDLRFSAIVDDVGYMLQPQIETVLQSAVERAVSMWPASAKSYVNRKQEVSTLLGQIVGMIKNVPGELASELMVRAKERADTALASRQIESATVKPDAVTEKRTRKGKGKPVQVEGDTLPEQTQKAAA